MTRCLFLVVVLPLLFPLPAEAGESSQLAARARGVFRQYCHRCHDGEGSQGGDFDVLKPRELAAAEMIVAKEPGDSYLLERVVKGEMPPPGELKLRSGDVSVLWRWIEAGAPDFPASAARAFVSLEDVLTAIRDDLRKAPRDKRTFLRYFTLHQLYNNPKLLEQDLRLQRAALSKAINSLSWSERVTPPRAVDARGVVFAIDVRDYQWDRRPVDADAQAVDDDDDDADDEPDDLWREIASAYPYGLKYRYHPRVQFQRLDREITELTQCAMPLIRADWFVATATRPPLYHTLLRLPEDAKELESDLEVDILGNFRRPGPDRIARGGFAKSGVSGQNRLVERHVAKYGSYWKSYDFKPGSPRSNLTRFPLGPADLFPSGRHPHAAAAFAHDGGEIIFSLPNGLQGYLLIDNEDNRIDAGPIDVVSDALKTSGTPSILTGASCMACHKRGMIPFKDAIRRGSAVFGRAEQKVHQLYPRQEIIDRLVEQDTKRFMGALKKAIGPFLLVGVDKGKPLDSFPEPVGEVARAYRLAYLDLKAVACEMDIQDPQRLLQAVGEKPLKRLGLERLLSGGLIGRQDWETLDGTSLMQDVAHELRFTPFTVR